MSDLLERAVSAVDARLHDYLATEGIAPRLIEAMNYVVFGGGKRLRPMLTCAAAHLRGAAIEAALAPAAAVEMIHAYSLVHDDLPAMDDDDLRRGRPTCHVAYDEATAILVGDALQSLAFEAISTEPSLSAEARVAMVACLSRAAGAPGMVGGQMLDMAAEQRRIELPELERLHAAKTGALISASVELGALAAGPLPDEELRALRSYASAVGLGFQIIDDVLDATADAETLGKTPGKDAAAGKSTYVTLLGLDSARQQASEQLDTALAAIAPWGDRAEPLERLAHLCIERRA